MDILALLKESDLVAAKKAAPGWDIYMLGSIYNEGAAQRGRPKFPAKAFAAWCKLYTKGKPP